MQINKDLVISGTRNSLETVNKIATKQIMNLYSSNLTGVHATYKPVDNWQLWGATGSLLTYQSNGVKIGAGVTKVLISGHTFINNGTSGDGIYIGLMKNGSQYNGIGISTVWGQMAANNYNITLSLSPLIVDVEEGDIVNLGLRYNNGSKTNAYFNRTYMTVEVIEYSA